MNFWGLIEDLIDVEPVARPLDKLWEIALPDGWSLAVNITDKPFVWNGWLVPAHYALALHIGLPAGWITPHGDQFVQAGNANPEGLAAAIGAQTAELRNTAA